MDASYILPFIESTKSVFSAIKAGVNNYIIKPFTPETLGQRVEETITKHQAA